MANRRDNNHYPSIDGVQQMSSKLRWNLFVISLMGIQKTWPQMKKAKCVKQSEMFEIEFYFAFINNFIAKHTEADVVELGRLTVPLLQLVERAYNKLNVEPSTKEEKVAFVKLFFPDPIQAAQVLQAVDDPQFFQNLQVDRVANGIDK